MWEIVQWAMEKGVLGVACLGLTYALIRIYNHAREDKAAAAAETKALREALSAAEQGRTDDAKRYTNVALQLQGEVISSVASINKSSEENAKLCRVVEKFVEAVEKRSLAPKQH